MKSKLENQRLAELDLIKSWIKPGMKVLEIGGGNGFQANILNSWGCNVTSIDLASRNLSRKEYYNVQEYNGKDIPMPANHFDLIFSSNVLEHVEQLPELFNEMRRVLKPSGLLIHILPTVSWRTWTSIAHYGFIVKYLFFREKACHGMSKAPSATSVLSFRGVKRLLWAGPHGVYPSSISELHYFRKKAWRDVFTRNGFIIKAIFANHLFYTGYNLFPVVTISMRKKIAPILGSSCNIFVMTSANCDYNDKI